MLMSAPKYHMTAFKASRIAQILMAHIIVIVHMDTLVTGRHSATKVGITSASNGGVMDYS